MTTTPEGAPGGAPLAEGAIPTNGVNSGTAPAVAPTLRSGRAQRELPAEVTKVIELVEAGAGEEVVQAYVANSSIPYELTLDDILYLRDIGIPDGVVAGMMRRGSELREQQAEIAALQTNLGGAVSEIRASLAARGEATEPGREMAAEGSELAGPAPLAGADGGGARRCPARGPALL